MAASNKLPAVDGSNLVGITVSQVSGAFANSGNTFGAAATLGTNDNFALNLETNGATAMTILGDGNVGIGTPTPAGVLDVQGGTAAASANGRNIVLTAGSGGTGNTNGGHILLMPGARSGTGNYGAVGVFGTPAAWMGQVLYVGGGIVADNGVTAGSFAANGNGFGFYGSNARMFSANSAADLTFDTGAASSIERMRINSVGNVGIGTAAPNQLLTVEGPMSLRAQAAPTLTANYGKVYVDSADADKLKYMNPAGAITDLTAAGSVAADSLNFTDFSDTLTLDASTDILASGTNALSITNTGTGESFRVNDQSGDASPFVITAAGDVGIGTSAPTVDLDVYGVARIGYSSGANTYVELGAEPSGQQRAFVRARTNRALMLAAHGKTEQLTFEGIAPDNIYFSNFNLLGVGTASPGTKLDVDGAITSRPLGTATGETGQLIMRELLVNGTHTATIRSPDSLAGNYVLTLPIDDGTPGQTLQTDGSGLLTWVTPGAGSSFVNGGNSFGADATLGTNDNYALNFEANGATALTILPSGVVGIGITSPTAGYALEAAGIIRSTGSSGGQRVGYNCHNSSSAANASGCSIRFDMGSVARAEIKGYAGSASTAGHLAFETRQSGTLTETMRIDENGRVGVGTASPQNLMHIAGASPVLNVNGTSGAGSTAELLLSTSTVGLNDTGARLVATRTDVPTNGSADLAMYTSNGTTQNLNFIVKSDGKVGIGTTAPQARLHVEGRIVSTPGTDADALTALTLDFTSANLIRATGASAACGTLDVTNTTAGGSFTVTIANATALCTTINWNGSTTNVKLPGGYVGGVAVTGVIYTFLDDGARLWVSYVPF